MYSFLLVDLVLLVLKFAPLLYMNIQVLLLKKKLNHLYYVHVPMNQHLKDVGSFNDHKYHILSYIHFSLFLSN
jgi:hypothetical protein